jgi:hypothetical protein
MTLCCGNILAQNEISEPTQEPMAPYRLFRTTNMWTFIELDTMTGLMWQIQFDVQGNNRGSFVLNDKSLLDGGKSISGRFTLYPTANMYTFILLDQINGRTWQVQWSSDEKNRFVLPISK